MKKYLLILCSLLALLIGYQYLVYNKGFYIKLTHDEITAPFVSEEKTIYRVASGKKEPFTVKGVLLTSFVPNHYFSDYAADEDTYERWLTQIHEMGANTVRVSNLMDDDFYNALYKFNTEHKQPLYLLQGIDVSDYAQNNRYDAFSDDVINALKQQAISAVDIIHGNKNILLNQRNGKGIYRKDVSKWVLGFVIGNDWNSDTIAYTNHKNKGKQFQGKYVSTKKEATAFEVMLANIMEQFYRYESDKYDMQHLISISSDPKNDPFTYDENYALQSHKIASIDSEHFIFHKRIKSGFFNSYHMYDIAKGTLSSIEDKRVEQLVKQNGTSENKGYVQLLANYHTHPTIIGSYGYSTSRGVDDEASVKQYQGGMNEVEQGEALVSSYKDFIANGMSGAIINSWNDNWGLRTWNTSFAKDVDRSHVWNDVQSINQGYGLMCFDDGIHTNKYQVDGDVNEWKTSDLIFHKQGTKLYMHSDSTYVYIMIQKRGLNEQDKIYIPIDITPESGVDHIQDSPVKFTRNADFLLQINGLENSRLYSTARYNALYENYAKEVYGDDPFVEIPAFSDAKFQPIEMIVKRDSVIENFADTPPQLRRSPTYESGKLHYGNGNPASKDFDSQSDFCFGKDNVEIRIPWLMLNFYNPSEKLVHADYYEHYGVEGLAVEKLYAGVSVNPDGKAAIKMKPYTLSGWDEAVYHERLKQSYEIIKQYWKEGVS